MLFQDFKLDAATIFGHVGASMMTSHKMGSVCDLLSCVRDSGFECNIDDVIAPCIDAVASDASMSKEVEELIRMMRSDVNRINAFIASGRLKSAYMLAVKTKRSQVVEAVARKAHETGQKSVKTMCEKWLQSNGP